MLIELPLLKVYFFSLIPLPLYFVLQTVTGSAKTVASFSKK